MSVNLSVSLSKINKYYVFTLKKMNTYLNMTSICSYNIGFNITRVIDLN